MRTFYIFKINKEIAILTKVNPYNIYKNIEQIKKLGIQGLSLSYNIYEQLISRIDSKKYNSKIYRLYKDNDYYQKNRNIHCIHNKYKPEDTILEIKNSYLLLQTNYLKPAFLKELTFDSDLFVCDFDNRDFFWIDEITYKSC